APAGGEAPEEHERDARDRERPGERGPAPARRLLHERRRQQGLAADPPGAHDGHGIGRGSVGPTHPSKRRGSLWRRIEKRVYLPISPGAVTRISSTTPAASACAKRRKLISAAPVALP